MLVSLLLILNVYAEIGSSERAKVESIKGESLGSQAVPFQGLARNTDGAIMRTAVEGVRLRTRKLYRIHSCSPLPKGRQVTVLERLKLGETWWLKVSSPSCPKAGYVPEAQIQRETNEVVQKGEPAGPNTEVVKEVRHLAGITSAPSRQVLVRSRGLYRFPIRQETSHVGSCGSFHYLPDAGLVDSFINKKFGCNFISLLQSWRENSCPDQTKGCRIAWGDISHKTKLRWNGHKTHLYGRCVDLRPLRKGEFKNAALWWYNDEYDGEATEAFIRLLWKHGATVLYFNDPKIIRKGLARRKGGHDNHIHVCFNTDSRSQSQCRKFQFKEDLCQNLAMGRMR